MPRFEPFAALRFDPSAAGADLAALIAPPYDVLTEADIDELGARSPHNIVHVDVPREAEGPDRYHRAAATLHEWIDRGVMVAEPAPSFTLYRMRFTDAAGAARDIVGVLGGLEVVDEGVGGVLPHERTTPKASTDRLDLTRATGANLSPVWGLSLASGLTEVLADPGETVGSVTVDGVEHSVERVTDPARLGAISAAVGADDVLIADGHHRYGIARTYRDEVRAARGEPGADADRSDADLTLTFVSELVADQLSVEAIHRVYRGVLLDELTAALARSFELTPAGRPRSSTLAEMVDRGALCLVTPDGAATWLTPRPGAFDGVRSLDGAWLEHALDGLDVDVAYQHGLDDVVGLVTGEAVTDGTVTNGTVTGGTATAAVLIRPVSVAEIERTAREGLLMPPKSTFFTPKLRTGFVVRPMG